VQNILYIVGFLVLLVAFLRFRHIVRDKALRAECLPALANVYEGFKPIPGFELNYHYGYPAFTITFHNKEQREEAERLGLNSRFIGEIGRICKTRGSSSRPFEAKRAVFFSYTGYVTEFLAKHQPK
jgi:hypothetical protein